MQLQDQLAISTLVLLCMTSTGAMAENQFVRAGASGNGSGEDWANARTSLPNTLVRGDTYYLADGTYGSYTFDDPESGASAITIRKATASDHGTETGWIDSYGNGEALFTGSDTLWRFTRGNYVIDGSVGSGKSPGEYGIRLYSTASRCSGSNMSEFGSTANRITLRHIEWDWDNGTSACSQNAPVMLGAWGQKQDDIVIENTYWHHGPAYVFYAGGYPGDEVHRNWIVRNNHFYMIGGGGGTSAHWELFWWMNIDDSRIEHNIFENCYGSTAAQTGWLMIGRTDNLAISGNVFFCSDSNYCSVGGNGVIATWSNDIYRNTNIFIYNNTFANLSGGYGPKIYFFHNTADDSNIVVKNNLYYNRDFSWEGVDAYSNEACGGGQSCSGTNSETGITSNIFVDYASFDLRLASGTQPGETLSGNSSLAVDRTGNQRGEDGVWDRGAYEFSGSAIARPNPPESLSPD